MASVLHASRQLTSRVLAGTLGGYAFTWGFIALGAMLLFAVGMDFDEASSLVSMLGFLLFLAMFCWAFISSSLARVWGVLVGGGAAMGGCMSTWWRCGPWRRWIS